MLSDCPAYLDYYAVNDIFIESQVSKLAKAAAEGDVKEIHYLTEQQHVDVNSEGYKKVTPLMWAVLHRNVDGVNSLLAHGADPNRKNDYSGSAMYFAARYGSKEILNNLLHKGGSIDIEGPDGMTLLMGALKNDNWETVHYLVEEKKVDVNDAGSYHTSPVISCAEEQSFDQVYYLLEHGASFYVEDGSGYTLGHELESKHPTFTGQYDWRDKCREFLETRGVKFPLPKPPRRRILKSEQSDTLTEKYVEDMEVYRAEIAKNLGHKTIPVKRRPG